jgi:hypothetical protein
MKIIETLKGKKTYILAVIGGIVFTLQILGIIDNEVASQILTFLGLGSIATIRNAIK